MSANILRTSSAVLFAFALTVTSAAVSKAEDGIVKVKSAYSVSETIERLKKDIAAKGIMFFSEIDQSKLAANAGVKLRPSTLLVFGNPPLGTLFLTVESELGARLAGAAAGDPGREGRRLYRLYGLRLDREAPQHHEPQGAVRHREQGRGVDHVERAGEIGRHGCAHRS